MAIKKEADEVQMDGVDKILAVFPQIDNKMVPQKEEVDKQQSKKESKEEAKTDEKANVDKEAKPATAAVAASA